MSAPIIQLRSRIPSEHLRGKLLTAADARVMLTGDVDVFKPDGTPLVLLRRGAIPVEQREHAYPALHELRKRTTDNRGAYAGATRMAAAFDDGSKSKNTRTRDANGKRFVVASATIGYFDRQGGRFPFCRETAFTGQEPEQWATIVPMIETVANLFKAVAPARYQRQLDEVRKCPREFVIGQTPFTTLTVNNNVAPSACHTDKGDFKSGLGAITCVRRGSYTGGLLIFPEYQVGADLGDGDTVFFNSHEWHGVTEMVKETEDAERITVVYYMREKMRDCLPPKEQLEALRAKQALE